ncbi:MAG: hypothetical protein V3S55_12830, partial [Nitrospiraceae bacterium]
TYGGYRVRKVGGRLDTTLITEALVINHRTQTYLTFYNTCCAIFGLTVIPSSITGPVGVVFPLAVIGLDSCSGLSVTLTSSASYSSATPSIASVNSLGVVALLAPGSTSVTAHVNSWIDSPFCLTFATAIGPDLLPPLPCGCVLFPAAVAAAILVEDPPPPPNFDLSCDNQHLALGSTAPTTTKTGSCTTSNISPTGGTFTWGLNKNTVTLDAGGGAANYFAANPSTSQNDTIISPTYTVNNQQLTKQSAPITVHKPTSLFVESDTTNPTGNTCNVSCLDGSPGCSYNSYLRTRFYVVKDQFNQLFTNVGINTVDARESFFGVTSTCGGSVETGSDTGNRFRDDFRFCSSACLPGGGGCASSATQTITVNGFPVRTVNVNWTCTGVTLNP